MNNVVDSSGWVEYFVEGPNAAAFAPAIERVADLVVPSICILEVFKHVLKRRGEKQALRAIAVMQGGRIVDLDMPIALQAARLGLEYKLPLADSVILATALAHDAILWTQDADFHGMDGVKYFPAAMS